MHALRVVRITLAIALATALGRGASAAEYDLYATVIQQDSANWANLGGAVGNPGCVPCSCTNGSSAYSTAGGGYLNAVLADLPPLAPCEVISQVLMNVQSRYNNGDSACVRMRAILQGSTLTIRDSPTHESSAGECKYRMRGEADITSLRNWTRQDINLLELGVRRSCSIGSASTLRVNAIRVRVVTTLVDSDGDGVGDCADDCPSNPNIWDDNGCGCNPVDSDGDGVCDPLDACPLNPVYLYTTGPCNCDETDSDGDGALNCVDECPFNANLTREGSCGCSSIDPDGDGIPSPCDDCYCAPGFPDADGDGVCDCEDGCPYNPDIIIFPSGCSCNPPDSDGDGVYDCVDVCPLNPAYQYNPGPCNCDDTDTDGDGTLDCVDECPTNPELSSEDDCGCDSTDSDGDGFLDCVDECPFNEDLTKPWICECDTTDSDSDGVLDCEDACPHNPAYQFETGPCNCDDTDSDDDSYLDCEDECPFLVSDSLLDHDGDGLPNFQDTDNDGDGVPDEFDAVPCNRFLCGDDDNDDCDDCASGRYRPESDCRFTPEPIRIATDGVRQPSPTIQFMGVSLQRTRWTPELVEWSNTEPVQIVDSGGLVGEGYELDVPLLNVPEHGGTQGQWGLSFGISGSADGLFPGQRIVIGIDIGDDDDETSLFGLDSPYSYENNIDFSAGRNGFSTRVVQGVAPGYGIGNDRTGEYVPTGEGVNSAFDASTGTLTLYPPDCLGAFGPDGINCGQEGVSDLFRNTYMLIDDGDESPPSLASGVVTLNLDSIVVRFETPWKDCNANGEWDVYDVETGVSADINGDLIPDSCQILGDVNGDGTVGFADLIAVLSSWGPCEDCPEDINNDGDVTFDDLLHVLTDWGT